jgi:hypothetical protein
VDLKLPGMGERREATDKGGMNDLQLSSESACFWKPQNLLGKAEEGFLETRENCFCK